MGSEEYERGMNRSEYLCRETCGVSSERAVPGSDASGVSRTEAIVVMVREAVKKCACSLQINGNEAREGLATIALLDSLARSGPSFPCGRS